MNTAMTQKELEAMLDQAVREVTERTAGVKLCPGGEPPGEDLCTVCISFNKGFHTSLSLCAETSLLARMARNALGEDSLNFQDLEDFGKEYFNVLCGKIAAALYRITHVAARFSVPVFYRGRYTPQGHQVQFMLTYTDEYQKGAQLIHHVPHCEDGLVQEI